MYVLYAANMAGEKENGPQIYAPVPQQKYTTMTTQINNFFEMLDKVEATDGRLEKIAYITNYIRSSKEADDIAGYLFKVAYDPFLILDTKVNDDIVCDPENQRTTRGLYFRFSKIIDQLLLKELRGNAARDAVNNFLSTAPINQAKWYKRIINKHLNCGVSVKTINKIMPGLIKVFGIKKAGMYDGFEINEEDYIIEKKIDGFRMICIPGLDGTHIAYSSNGKPLYNVEHVLANIDALDPEGYYVFDGEIVGKDWNHTAKIVTKMKGPRNTETRYACFDVIQNSEYQSGEFEMSLMDRIKIRDGVIGFNDTEYIDVLGSEPIRSSKDVKEAGRYYVQEGFEGGRIKESFCTLFV